MTPREMTQLAEMVAERLRLASETPMSELVAAQYLDISVRTLKERVAQCRIRCNKVQGKAYFWKHDLDDYIRTGETVGGSILSITK